MISYAIIDKSDMVLELKSQLNLLWILFIILLLKQIFVRLEKLVR